MRAHVVHPVCMVLLLSGSGCDSSGGAERARLKEENAALRSKLDGLEKQLQAAPSKTAANTLPASLANLYPPKSKQPEWQLQMQRMTAPLEALMSDLSEGDTANASKDFQEFKSLYAATAKLVPEWEKAFPMAPIDEADTALQSGNQEKLMAAMSKVEGVCSDCHAQSMADAQFVYRWPDITELKVTDPVSKKAMPYLEFKGAMSANFSGIGVDLQQGQPEAAKKQYQEFAQRFAAHAGICVSCHKTERRYYITAEIQTSIKNLGALLTQPPKDPAALGALAEEIGSQACNGCHAVHVPASMAKMRARSAHAI